MITTVLRNRFVFGPPSLSDMIKPFAGHEHLFELFRLTKEFLPQEYKKVVGMTPADAAATFTKQFSQKYFPLHIYNHFGDLYPLVRSIPVQFRSLNRLDYEPAYRKLSPGQLFAEVICTCPFEDRDDRPAVIDAFSKLADKSILLKIPAGGLTLQDVEEALNGSKHKGLLWRCRWVFGMTGNTWLDGENDFDWSRENVELLKHDWPACQAIEKEMQSFDSWMGHDFPKRSAEVIDFIHKQYSKRLMEVLR